MGLNSRLDGKYIWGNIVFHGGIVFSRREITRNGFASATGWEKTTFILRLSHYPSSLRSMDFPVRLRMTDRVRVG